MKSTTDCPDSETDREEETHNSLNLWLPTNSTNSPSASSDDAIQLSRTVILYVKAGRGRQGSPVSSHPSLQWSSHEEDNFLSSAPVTRNSSFDAAGARARITQIQAGSQENEEEELH